MHRNEGLVLPTEKSSSFNLGSHHQGTFFVVVINWAEKNFFAHKYKGFAI